MTALYRANEIRLARADEKNKIRALPTREGKEAVAALLLDPPECLKTMTVAELIGCVTRWGATRARKFCHANMVGEMKAIGGLTDRQRHAIGHAFVEAL